MDFSQLKASAPMIRKLFRKLLSTPFHSHSTETARTYHWTYGGLEERVLLAADAGIAIAEAGEMDAGCSSGYYSTKLASVDTTANQAEYSEDAVGLESAAQVVQLEMESLRSSAEQELLFIDSRVDDLEALVADASASATVFVVPANVSGLEFVSKTLARFTGIRSVHIVGHGQSGFLQLGNEGIHQASIHSHQSQLSRWKDSVVSEGDILLYGCNTGAGDSGRMLADSLARATDLDVAASSDTTGASRLGGNWQFETVVGLIQTEVAFSESLQSTYASLLPLTILAAGQTGEESMELQIDGAVVATWDNIGGDIEQRVYQSFTYDGDVTGISLDRIRVAFTNDIYIPSQNFDRNLLVKSIQIGDEVYETDQSTVFGSGTLNPETGTLGSGFFGQNVLFVNGYFQYAQTAANDRTLVIEAAGDTGEEQMQVFVDNRLVATFDNIGGNARRQEFLKYTVTLDTPITIEQVRIAFTNDFYDEDREIDRNLRIRSVAHNDRTYLANAPSVFSTGTFNESTQDIRPGFFEDGTLHTNGYLTFDDNVANDGTPILIRAAGSEGGEQMNLIIDGQVVRSWIVERGADQIEYEWYAYRASSELASGDVFIQFVGDEFSETVDKNLRVDFITIDGVVYQTEATSVFSTGSWKDGAIIPGFREVEYLNTDGTFQFALRAPNSGSLAFISRDAVVTEGSFAATLFVIRTGGSEGTLSVQYATADGTALAGEDYLATSGRLTFQPGQTTLAIQVEIFNDRVSEETETFQVTLSNLRGSGSLGTIQTATVSIRDNDSLVS